MAGGPANVKAAKFRRVFLIILDGVGVGALPDAGDYGDTGANTLLHVAKAVDGIDLPCLQDLGLGCICPAPGLDATDSPKAGWGRLAEVSVGKDTTTGHWELAGLPTQVPFQSYPDGFPPEIIDLFRRETGLDPIGNISASGTEIIRILGEEHLRTGRPIVYTSVDSVFQIAAHEEVIPPNELYRICRKMRKGLDPYRIGRVIARPFVGSAAGHFTRTPRRQDFSMPPGSPTVLDLLTDNGLPVIGIGKISDIFAGQGISTAIPTSDNRDGMQQILAVSEKFEKGLIFANLVDFDMHFGHRKDTNGFARALREFDGWLAEFLKRLGENDLLLITADHGCDPTTPGTDHSREFVPMLAWNTNMKSGRKLGDRACFCDVAATLAESFGLTWSVGNSFRGLL